MEIIEVNIFRKQCNGCYSQGVYRLFNALPGVDGLALKNISGVVSLFFLAPGGTELKNLESV